MYVWMLLAALGVAVVAIGFFVVTIFSLQDMLEAQRKTEDRLRENEEWLRAVIDNAKTVISVKRLDGRYIMMNGRFEALFGVSALLAHATEALRAMPGVQLVGTAAHKAGILSFVVDGIHPHDLGTILDTEGVAIRAGHHCAMPVMTRFGIPGTARASFALYNGERDVAALVAAIGKAQDMFGTRSH